MPHRPAITRRPARLATVMIALVAIVTVALAGPSDASAAPIVRQSKPWGSPIPPAHGTSPGPVTGRRPSATRLDSPSDGTLETAPPPRDRGEEEDESETRDPPEPEPEAPDVDVSETAPGRPAGSPTEGTAGAWAAATPAPPAADEGGGAPGTTLVLLAAVTAIAAVSVVAIRAVRR